MPRARKYDREGVRGGLTARAKETVLYEGLTVPASFTLRLFHEEWPAGIQLGVQVDPHAGPIPTQIEAIPHAKVTPQIDPETQQPGVRFERTGDHSPVSYRDVDEALRATFDVGDLLRKWTYSAMASMAVDLAAADRGTLDNAAIKETIQQAHSSWQRVERRRRQRITDDTLREVADIYRQAMDDELPPTMAVAEHFVVSHSTAARWVRRARDIGALGPAKSSNPGGQG